MFTILDLKELCETTLEVINDRQMLLEENIYLREQLEEKRKNEERMYQENIKTTADILNILIEKADTEEK